MKCPIYANISNTIARLHCDTNTHEQSLYFNRFTHSSPTDGGVVRKEK